MSVSEPSVELFITGDGSHSLYVPSLEENYHSIYGALSESRHIFIEAGLHHMLQPADEGNILEIGFGTGLNAFLTLVEAERNGQKINYTAIEKHPLDHNIFNRLNYPDLLGHRAWFHQLHACPWNEEVVIDSSFCLKKLKVALQDFQPPQREYDLVYFDAFGPEVQPEMWSLEVFNKIASGIKKGGILVTYSTKGIVKRALKEAGFGLEKMPGPPGKREILRATLLESPDIPAKVDFAFPACRPWPILAPDGTIP